MLRPNLGNVSRVSKGLEDVTVKGGPIKFQQPQQRSSHTNQYAVRWR